MNVVFTAGYASSCLSSKSNRVMKINLVFPFSVDKQCTFWDVFLIPKSSSIKLKEKFRSFLMFFFIDVRLKMSTVSIFETEDKNRDLNLELEKAGERG